MNITIKNVELKKRINMGNELFEKALPILNQIEKHHFEAYFVGGAVRDYIMHRTIHDIDITTSAMRMKLKIYLNTLFQLKRAWNNQCCFQQ